MTSAHVLYTHNDNLYLAKIKQSRPYTVYESDWDDVAENLETVIAIEPDTELGFHFPRAKNPSAFAGLLNHAQQHVRVVAREGDILPRLEQYVPEHYLHTVITPFVIDQLPNYHVPVRPKASRLSILDSHRKALVQFQNSAQALVPGQFLYAGSQREAICVCTTHKPLYFCNVALPGQAVPFVLPQITREKQTLIATPDVMTNNTHEAFAHIKKTDFAGYAPIIEEYAALAAKGL